ncbi:hypothetical protein [Candidatus Similichlamydia laticola]|uniref:Uncharacterized protein n=1 Tax=Candidatus Similichlamydia laticola TaxID=2170265 RepID=A0A369KFX2_9BACT|nr:hypothetical protein [Candidatus Similichlamydia laticola]RDB31605.1 hypothetical protein HAT2_00288 [Candidatus Similichlamydia laticola]
MTANIISVPFCTRTRTGNSGLELLFYEDFIHLTSRVRRTASGPLEISKTYSERNAFRKKHTCLLIVLPTNVEVNPDTGLMTNGQLKIVVGENCLYVGFIPFLEQEARIVQNAHNVMRFYHHRLESIEKEIERTGPSSQEKTLLKLPSENRLKCDKTQFFVEGLFFILLFDSKYNTYALLCCKEPIPPEVPIPILCPKTESSLPKQKEEKASKWLHMSGLKGLKFFQSKLPIFSKRDFDERKKPNGLFLEEKIEMGRHETFIIILPHGCSLGLNNELKGGELCLIQSDSLLEIGFIPTSRKPKVTYNTLYFFQRALLDGLSSSQYVASGDNCTRLVLSPSNGGNWHKMSFFLLVSKTEDCIAILCQKGLFELKGIYLTKSNSEPILLDTLETAPPKEKSQTKEPTTSLQARVENIIYLAHEKKQLESYQEVKMNPRQGTPEKGTTSSPHFVIQKESSHLLSKKLLCESQEESSQKGTTEKRVLILPISCLEIESKTEKAPLKKKTKIENTVHLTQQQEEIPSPLQRQFSGCIMTKASREWCISHDHSYFQNFDPNREKDILTEYKKETAISAVNLDHPYFQREISEEERRQEIAKILIELAELPNNLTE